MINVNWCNAPQWANWIALSPYGLAYMYEKKPMADLMNKRWSANGGRSEVVGIMKLSDFDARTWNCARIGRPFDE